MRENLLRFKTKQLTVGRKSSILIALRCCKEAACGGAYAEKEETEKMDEIPPSCCAQCRRYGAAPVLQMEIRHHDGAVQESGRQSVFDPAESSDTL